MGTELTAREHDVLRLLALGYTNREVSGELEISIRTAEAHRASIRSKLAARTRADLVRHAGRIGLSPAAR